MDLIGDWQETPQHIQDDKGKVNLEKDSKIEVLEQIVDCNGSRDIEGDHRDDKQNKTTDFEGLEVDDGKEEGKDVDCNNKVDEEKPKWIGAVSPSRNEKKAKFSELWRATKGRGSQKEETRCISLSFTVLLRNMAEQRKAWLTTKIQWSRREPVNSKAFNLTSAVADSRPLLKWFWNQFIQFWGGVNTMSVDKPMIYDWDEDGRGDGEHPDKQEEEVLS